MSSVVFGLDIGTHAIKACRARRSVRGVQVERAFYHLLPPDGTEEERQTAVLEGLHRFLLAAAAGSCPVWTALPVSAAFLHTLDLPVNKEGKIREVVPFELESHLPVSLEDVVIDFVPTGIRSRRGVAVLAAAVPGSEVGAHLNLLARAGIDPVGVGLDLPAAVRTLPRRREEREGPPQILIDLGAAKTSFAVIREGRVFSLRSFPLGGLHLTRALAEENALFIPQAEEFKKNGLPEDFRRWPRAAASHFEYLRRELERTLHLTRQGTSPDGRPSAEIVLCGGGARTRGLREYLAASLACPVSVLRPGIGNPRGSSAEDESQYAVSGGLALAGMARQPGFDFRREDFAPAEPRDRERVHLATTAAGLVLLVILGGASLWWRMDLESRRVQGLHARMVQTYREVFPRVRRVVDPVVQMRQGVAQAQEKLKGVAAFGPDSTGPLRLLRELSERIPPRLQWTVNQLSFSPQEVSLQGKTDSFDAVQEIRRALETSPLFSSVRVNNVRGGGEKGKEAVEASFVLSLKKAPGESSGNGKEARRAPR